MTVNISTIICDDVRQENNGKFLYIGVYNNEIVINQDAWLKGSVTLPQLNFVACVRNLEQEAKKNVVWWLTDPNGKLHSVKEKMKIEHSFLLYSNVIAFTIGGITFKDLGEYCFHVTIDGCKSHKTKFKVSASDPK